MMENLSYDAKELLRYLVEKLDDVAPDDPKTYVSYMQVHDDMGLQKKRRYGASLQKQGLNELAEWTFANRVPGITGLIINKTKKKPGAGYFNLYNREPDDLNWWQAEIKSAKTWKWSKYFNNFKYSDFVRWLELVGKSAKTAKNYAGAISGTLTKWSIGNGLIKVPIQEIIEASLIVELSEKLKGVKIFRETNDRGRNMYSCALKSYAEFLRDLANENIEDDLSKIMNSSDISDTQKSTLINARVGQGKYRQQLIDIWEGCAVTGYRDQRFLVASHIKPWRESNSKERLDPFNGLLLLPNIDKVFDLGYITFSEKGELIVSKQVEYIERLGIDKTMVLKTREKNKPYLTYHRKEIYKG